MNRLRHCEHGHTTNLKERPDAAISILRLPRSLRSLVMTGIISMALTGMSHAVEELQLAAAPLEYAPLDIMDAPKVSQSLTGLERRELVKEFEGVLSMAVREYSYGAWPGRSMSDCLKTPQEAWSQQCEMITPQTNSYYRFFGSSESAAHLKQVDIRFHVADPLAMNDLAKSVSKLLGKGQRTDEGWRWNTGSQKAVLSSEQPLIQGDPAPLHFTWTR